MAAANIKRTLRQIRRDRSIYPYSFRRNRKSALTPLPPGDPSRTEENRTRAELSRRIAESIVTRGTFKKLSSSRTSASK